MIPIISGTVGGQSVADNGTIKPFATASVYDPNPWTTDTVTVTLLDGNGKPTDNNGSLQLASDASRDDTTLTKTDSGTYVLNDLTGHQANTFVAGLNAYLNNLQFIPAAGSDGTTVNMQIALTDQDNEHVYDTKTSVTIGGSGPMGASTSAIDAKQPDVMLNQEIASGTTLTVSGDSHLTIQYPGQFQGTAELLSGVLSMDQLSEADSYTFKNDMLSINGGGKTLETINLAADSKPFTVEKVGSQVSIYTADDPRHLTGGTIFSQS